MRISIIKYIRLRAKDDQYFALGKLSDDDLDAWIDRNFSFVSMNASNMMHQMSAAARSAEEKEMDKKYKAVAELGSLDGNMLIVDEAHNLFRAITNGSKNAMELYKVITQSKNLRLIFLTGTPIASDPFELVPCFNMLARRDGKPILPEDWKTFYQLYVNMETGHIKNKNKFQNRIFGLISYVSHKTVKEASAVEFPEELKPKIVFVNMSSRQYMLYTLAREKEREEGKMRARYRGKDIGGVPLLQKPKSDTASSYRVRSRQISNYAPPESQTEYVLGNVAARKLKLAREIMTDDTALDVAEKQKRDAAGIVAEVKDVRAADILSKIPDADIYSPKLEAILNNIMKHDGQLGIIYSQFVGVGGLGVFQRYLRLHGFHLYSGQDVEKINEHTNQWLVTEPMKSEHTAEKKQGGDDSKLQMYPKLLSKKYNKEKTIDIKSPTAKSWKRYLKDAHNVSLDISPSTDKSKHECYAFYTCRRRGKTIEMPISGGKDKPAAKESSSRRRTFAVVYGDIPVQEREKIKTIFNSDANKHGEIISLILLSSTGAEGLDLKNVRHVHVMEPYWNYSRINQVKHRAIRNESHVGLPPAERNVSTYIYLSIRPDETKEEVMEKLRLLPRATDERVSAAITQDEISDDGDIPSVGIVTAGPVPKNEVRPATKEATPNMDPLPTTSDLTRTTDPLTTDVKLFRESIKNQISIDSFTEACQEVSIECAYNEGAKCRICQPNNRTLFNDNAVIDIRGTDRCVPVEEKTVTAREGIVDGGQWYWVEGGAALLGVKVYAFAGSINVYRPVGEDPPIYPRAVDDLKKLKLLRG